MKTNLDKKPLWIRILKWAARIVALIFIVFILGMFIGEWFGERGQSHAHVVSTRDTFILSLWGMYLLGLIIGLRWLGLGGVISIVFLFVHIIILWLEGVPTGMYFYIMMIPSLFYMFVWYLEFTYLRQRTEDSKVVK